MRAPLTALLTVAVLAIGCASDSDAPVSEEPVSEDTTAGSDGSGTATEDPAETDAAPTGAQVTDAQGDVEIEIEMFSFEPEVVEIGVGETVTWTNQDATRHTATSGIDGDPDGTFEVTFDGRDDTASVTFDEPGEYAFFCSPHNFMTGTVVVTE